MGAEREVAGAQLGVVDLPPTAVVQEVVQAHSHLPVELAPEQVASDISIVTKVAFWALQLSDLVKALIINEQSVGKLEEEGLVGWGQTLASYRSPGIYPVSLRQLGFLRSFDKFREASGRVPNVRNASFKDPFLPASGGDLQDVAIAVSSCFLYQLEELG